MGDSTGQCRGVGQLRAHIDIVGYVDVWTKGHIVHRLSHSVPARHKSSEYRQHALCAANTNLKEYGASILDKKGSSRLVVSGSSHVYSTIIAECPPPVTGPELHSNPLVPAYIALSS